MSPLDLTLGFVALLGWIGFVRSTIGWVRTLDKWDADIRRREALFGIGRDG